MAKKPQQPRPQDDAAPPERPATERIVDAARELFCRDGIHATGIDRILSAAGASKMTLYTRFGSKEALVREVLTREGAEWRAMFFAAIEQEGGAPMHKLQQVIPALRLWFNSGRFYGCSFMNAAAEHSKGDPMLRELATQHHRHVLDFLGNLAEDAGLRDPALVARQILLTVDGTIAALMVSGDPSVLTVAQHNLQSVLTQAERGLINIRD